MSANIPDGEWREELDCEDPLQVMKQQGVEVRAATIAAENGLTLRKMGDDFFELEPQTAENEAPTWRKSIFPSRQKIRAEKLGSPGPYLGLPSRGWTLPDVVMAAAESLRKQEMGKRIKETAEQIRQAGPDNLLHDGRPLPAFKPVVCRNGFLLQAETDDQGITTGLKLSCSGEQEPRLKISAGRPLTWEEICQAVGKMVEGATSERRNTFGHLDEI